DPISNFDADLHYGTYQTYDSDYDRLCVVPAPGHSPDHVALWLETARVSFTGDVILGQGTTLVAPPEGDMAAYMRTLATLKALDARLIAPGHGPIVEDPAAVIDEYIRHRQDREQQVLAALQTGPATESELVARIYADVDPRLHDLAL